MSLYIKKLEANTKAIVDARDAEAEATKKLAVEAAEARLAPLSERLGRLLAQIPDTVKRKGLGVGELQRSLRGRQGRQAHQGEIAAALRALGWSSKRSWKRDSPDGFKSRWRPPGSA